MNRWHKCKYVSAINSILWAFVCIFLLCFIVPAKKDNSNINKELRLRLDEQIEEIQVDYASIRKASQTSRDLKIIYESVIEYNDKVKELKTEVNTKNEKLKNKWINWFVNDAYSEYAKQVEQLKYIAV